MALACFGLSNRATAASKPCLPSGSVCKNGNQCCSGTCYRPHYDRPHYPSIGSCF
jgi:hypothetical protein